VPALRFDQVLHNRKAESASSRRALPRRVGTIKAIEHARALMRPEVAALISNRDHHLIVLANGANPDRSIVRRMARRVGEQVDQHLPDPNGVATNDQIRRDLGLQTGITFESSGAGRRLDERCASHRRARRSESFPWANTATRLTVRISEVRLDWWKDIARSIRRAYGFAVKK
jgi:hypothetical protein